jgi:hypothetical protein
MQPPPSLKKIQAFFSSLVSKNNNNRSFLVLFIFLVVILLVSFIIPQLFFGRFYGSDAYSHLQATNIMASSRGISEFYADVADISSDPSDPSAGLNYPFGLWLLGGTIAKITGLPPVTSSFFFITLFFLILVGSFYVYSGTWLDTREQKLCAVLFMLSMPQISLVIMDYVPNIFILPFLFITLYFIFKDPVDWKLLPFALLSIFIIIISHTGTFVFFFAFCMAFFLLYCLFWGKFSTRVYFIILSILSIYVITLSWFPNIANQYQYTSQKLLLPGNFLANTFNFTLPGDIVRVFYTHMLVEYQFVYVVILAALLFAGSKILIYIHRKTTQFLSQHQSFPAFVLPIQNLSHGTITIPFWLGPVHVLFTVIGFFHLDNKGKCFLVTALLTTVLPDLFQGSLGISVGSGVLRQISYLIIIIPITATLGFWHILDYLNDPQSKVKTQISSALWVVVCLVIIITPALTATYYNPKISGEDYVIGGLKWLGENGDQNERVVGYQLRPLALYANMSTPELQSGIVMRHYLAFLKNIYFMPGDQIQSVKDFQNYFGVRYILSSDRILQYFGGTTENLTTDSNPALSKIYASNDYGIYDIGNSSLNPVPESSYPADKVSIKYFGGTYEIESDYYKVTLGAITPVLKRLGPPDNDYLNYGFLTEDFTITGTELSPGGDHYSLEDQEFTSEVKDNQITYRTVLIDPQNQVPLGTLLIRYTFYPDVIKREYVFSNDWLVAQSSPQLNVRYSINSFSLLKEFIVKNDKTRLERETVVYEDSVTKNMNIEDFYLHRGDEGIYITFDGISPQPSSISYSGSQNNRSSIVITQSTPVKPGASFLSTQFISLGSEDVAKKNIQSREGIELIPYPDGIIPILLSEDTSSQSDSFIDEKNAAGYAVLANNSLPYSNVINPTINPQDIGISNLSNFTLIGSQITTGAGYYDDYSTQETNMNFLRNTTNNSQENIYAGFMPYGLNYNLDTLSILSGNKIPFIFSTQVDPTNTNGVYAKGYRTPQIAYINSEPTGVVLFPVSYPKSNAIVSDASSETIFSQWKSIIDGAADNDEMVLLLLRSQDIGNPIYNENFAQLFSYAREKGLTFTTPAYIADHFKQIQNIRYSGFTDGDTASLNVTNKNNVTISNVTFRVTLPVLTTGNYQAINGNIVRIKKLNNQSILYINSEIPANSTKNIIVGPDIPRKSLKIGIPQFPVEGIIEITVKDEAGKPLPGVDVLVDATYYQTDENGTVRVNLNRGYYMITIKHPGYEDYSSIIWVKGRIYLIPNEISRIFFEG